MNTFGRVAVCGYIAEYNIDGSPRPLYNLNFNMIIKRLRISGFIVTGAFPAIL